MADEKNESKTISIRIEPGLKKELQVKAETAGLNLSQFMIQSALNDRVLVLGNGQEIVSCLHKILIEIQKPRETSSDFVYSEVEKIVLLLNKITEQLTDISSEEEGE